MVITVAENPVINRIVLEGNKRIKSDKITPEIKLAPRQIFTRSKVRADVARIIELYKRQGRFAASVEPKIVQLDQNRVDLVYEISEGAKSKIRQINIIGNQHFSDKELRSEMATKQARWFRFFSSNDTYDPDRLAFDQQKLRQFYLTQGYADFRVQSAVAELTPDRRDFIITYVVDEGQRYHFGPVTVDSDIRDLDATAMQRRLPMHEGDWYNAKQVEDTVDSLNELSGLFGYAFSDVRPQFHRDSANRTMAVNFHIAETPRVYVERVDISGNTTTRDKVIRREFRLAEGDPFSSVQVHRSRDRIQSLGFFQDNLEIRQEPRLIPPRIAPKRRESHQQHDQRDQRESAHQAKHHAEQPVAARKPAAFDQLSHQETDDRTCDEHRDETEHVSQQHAHRRRRYAGGKPIRKGRTEHPRGPERQYPAHQRQHLADEAPPEAHQYGEGQHGEDGVVGPVHVDAGIGDSGFGIRESGKSAERGCRLLRIPNPESPIPAFLTAASPPCRPS